MHLEPSKSTFQPYNLVAGKSVLIFVSVGSWTKCHLHREVILRTATFPLYRAVGNITYSIGDTQPSRLRLVRRSGKPCYDSSEVNPMTMKCILACSTIICYFVHMLLGSFRRAVGVLKILVGTLYNVADHWAYRTGRLLAPFDIYFAAGCLHKVCFTLTM